MTVPFDLWGQRGWAAAEVAGESHYRAAIRALFGARIPPDGTELTVAAQLLPEPQNRHDRDAVGVWVGSAQVGHLPREAAKRYAPALSALVAHGWTPQVGARVWGSEAGPGEFTGSVRLDLAEPHLIIPANQPPPQEHRLLPPGGAIQVTGEHHHLDALAAWLRPEGECWVHATLHEITEQPARSARAVVEVRIDGVRIGQLSPRMSGEVLAAVRHLAERGLVACARAIVKGNSIKTEVIVYAARAHELPESWLSDPPEAARHAVRNSSAADRPAGPSAAETAVLRVPAGQTTAPFVPPALDVPPPVAPVIAGAVAADGRAHDVRESGLPQSLAVPAARSPQPSPRPAGPRLNPPPNWPAPPLGWSPAPGWTPDPAWGPPPAGWQLWIDAPPDADRSLPEPSGMVARTWRGWAPKAVADEYQRHYETGVAPRLARLPGFRGARLLRRAEGDEVAFTSIVFFARMDDVRAFAGDDWSVAVVEEPARRVLSRWEPTVTHDEVAMEVLPR
ncbi:hypothetical protein Acy02nite_25910 [Actinoplanes cyaneus]|uniref:HIRAN domain-containing protein n=1 Tax=Actinoplanes cyaneus TaxID=52696 RepID=A0A919IES3_9ACTN|nr:HIRAN domain-containing protein [Actinoplanes cyaneus]MCW2138080.1 hypothetical protein [Actinoplanes cyaneus]GID64710.1 hypothetical protein Acy02nite_25910 [Actinoplanes cyaneus]